MESVLLRISGADEEEEDNDFFCPAFIFYFIKQWAPILPLWTAILLSFLPGEKTFQNNQAVEAHFSSLKRYQLRNPELEEEARNDFTKKRKVWEVGSFLKATRERYRYFILKKMYSINKISL